MKNNIITLIYLIVLSLISTACGSPTPLATGQLIPTTVPVKLTQTNIPIQPPTNIPAATSQVATEAVTPLLTNFQDPSHGFTFDYPIGWVLDTGSFGSRAPISYTLTSLDHEPGLVDEVPAGETILNLTIHSPSPLHLSSYLVPHASQSVTPTRHFGFYLPAEMEGYLILHILVPFSPQHLKLSVLQCHSSKMGR